VIALEELFNGGRVIRISPRLLGKHANHNEGLTTEHLVTMQETGTNESATEGTTSVLGQVDAPASDATLYANGLRAAFWSRCSPQTAAGTGRRVKYSKSRRTARTADGMVRGRV